MTEDRRCCGSGTCIIDTEGRCWCGQQWDGQKMCLAPLAQAKRPGRADVAEPASPPGPGLLVHCAMTATAGTSDPE